MRLKTAFSVLIPNYGYLNHIFTCIDSLVNQKNDDEFNYEIILLDQSDDDVFLKLKKQIKDKYAGVVKVCHSPQKGVFRARHKLMSMASGEYIVFVDSDDFVDLDYLSSLSSLISKKPSDIYVFSLKKCNEKGDSIPDSSNAKLLDKIKELDIKDYLIFSSNQNSVCTKVFRKDLYDFNDYNDVDFEVQNGDDFVFSYPLIKKAKSITFLPDFKKYHYREVSSSLTHKLNFELCKNIFRLKDKYLSNLKLTQSQKRIRLEDLIRFFSTSSQNLIHQKQMNKKQFNEYCDILYGYIKNEELDDTTFLTKKYVLIYRLIKARLILLIWVIFHFGSLRCRQPSNKIKMH